MKTYAFEGYSDDIFAEVNVTNYEVDNCANGKPIQFTLVDPTTNRGICITGHYNSPIGNQWVIGVSSYDPECKDIPIPEWPIRIVRSTECSHTPRLEIDAPDNCLLKHKVGWKW